MSGPTRAAGHARRATSATLGPICPAQSVRRSLSRAVCPARGVGAALVLPCVDIEALNLHRAEIATHITPGAHAVMTLDGAGWHTAGDEPKVPDNISLPALPPYSPALNPVENIWQYLRQNHLANRVFDTCEAIVEACCEAWNARIAQPTRITSIAMCDRVGTVNSQGRWYDLGIGLSTLSKWVTTVADEVGPADPDHKDRKSTRLNSSHQ